MNYLELFSQTEFTKVIMKSFLLDLPRQICPYSNSVKDTHPSELDLNLSNILEEKKSTQVTLSIQDYRFSLFLSSNNLPLDWDIISPPDNVFLQRSYLDVLEQNAPEGMSFAYLIFYYQEKPIGLSYFQTLPFNARKSVQGEELIASNIWQRLEKGWKNWLANALHLELLICGNALLTGDYNFYCYDKEIDQQTFTQLFEEAIEKTSRLLSSIRNKTNVILVKDIHENDIVRNKLLKKMRFTGFNFEPSMVLDISSQWHSFADYLSDMSSKYRVRAKRAFKKGKAVVKRQLSLPEIELHKQELFSLYQEVANNSDFNMVKLTPDYIPSLKNTFSTDFTVTGYFLEDELIGFQQHYKMERN